MNDGVRAKETQSVAAQDEVIFDPGARRQAILALMRSARRRLRLSVFRCTDFKILDELCAALDRGVRVDLLLTQKAKGWQKKLRDLALYLESMGAELHRYSRRGVKYHAKYVVADDSAAAVMSLNFTHKCFERTCDFVVVTRDAAVVSALQGLFDADCRPYDRPVPQMPERLIVSPEYSRERIGALIRRAKRRISIVDHKLQDPAILGLLQRKARAGVQVENLGHGALGPLESHGKLLIVDGEIASLGSIALSQPGLDKRREASIVIDDPICVKQLSRCFVELARAPAGKACPAPEEPGEDEEEEEEE